MGFKLSLDDEARIEEVKGVILRARIPFSVLGGKTVVLDDATDAESRFVVRILQRKNIEFTID